MTERFSAQGSADLWLASSIEALENSGFKNIQFEPGTDEVTGLKEGNLTVKVVPEGNDKAILTLVSDSENNINIYKKAVAQALARFQRQPEQNIFIKLNTPVGSVLDDEVTYELVEPQELPEPVVEEKAIEKQLEETPIIPEETINQVEEIPWYRTHWFALLICVLCPPVGIYLLWKFNIFYKKDRKIFSIFFGLYTILWLWLIYIIVYPQFHRVLVVETVDESGTQQEQIDAYWTQESVSNFMNQMPELINTYDNLSLNGELGSETGNETARSIYSQIQGLCEGVININEVSSDNAALPIQQQVNETANLFLTAIQEGNAALDNGDINIINNSLTSWSTAENSFYSISYVYDATIQSITDGNTDEIIDESTQVETGV